MIRLFVYLTACSVKNRLARRLRRLREPRYLAGMVVGLTYLYWFIVRPQLRAARHASGFAATPELLALAPIILFLGSLGLWVTSLLAWVWPSSDPPITFSRPEVQFFYPAPVTHRQLLNYKLFRSQLGILFGVLVASLFSGALLQGRLSFVVGLWLLFSTLRLHLIGVGFTRAGFRDVRSMRRWSFLPLGILAVLSIGLLAALAAHLPGLLALPLSDGFRRLVAVGSQGVPAVALWPFRALLLPVLAETTPQFLAAAWPAFLLLALNYWWVLRSDATLEEAAAAAEKKRATGQERAGAPASRRSPFHLRPAGRPEVAILWKNLIQFGRYASPRTVASTVIPLLILAVAIRASGRGPGLAALVLAVAGFLTVIGPYMLRNDLRLDMAQLSVLKSWPVRGPALLLGELLAPVAILTVMVWTALVLAFVLSSGMPAGRLTPTARLWVALAAASMAPAVIFAQLVVQNAAVILFPGWIPTGPTRPRGIEAMGQQMLMFAGTLVVFVVGVLPAALLAAAVGFGVYRFAGLVGLVPAGVSFAAVLLAESVLAVSLLGRVLERTEPAQVEGGEAGGP